MDNGRKGFYACFLKRFFDIMISLLVLVIFCWLYAVLAILVRILLGSPVFFRQERPGRIDPRTGKEKIFNLYKFRTMTDARGEDGCLLPDEQRMTGFGRWLRSTSLDEIPEMINILKGDMSLIGPRPLLVKYLDRYNEEQRHRHDVRPGLTGYAQAHGRNCVTWEDRFAMDVWYTRHISFATDARIILDTVKTVLRRTGVSSDSSVTMEEFMGTPEGVLPKWRLPDE